MAFSDLLAEGYARFKAEVATRKCAPIAQPMAATGGKPVGAASDPTSREHGRASVDAWLCVCSRPCRGGGWCVFEMLREAGVGVCSALSLERGVTWCVGFDCCLSQ